MNTIIHSFTIKRRLESFGFAAKGLKHMLVGEPNAVIHLVFSIAVVAGGLIMDISSGEWMAIVISIGIVWTAEILNTCIERIMDFLTSETKHEVAIIKDLAAAAVLVSSLSALTIGLIIFTPKIINSL